MPLVVGRKGFGGHSFIPCKRNLNNFIPWEGQVAEVSIRGFNCKAIYDKWGTIIYEWAEDYTPTKEEIEQQVNAYLKSIGRNVF